MKSCNHCLQEKDISEFHIHSNGKPRKQCKQCHLSRGKRWVQQNREHVNAKQRERLAKDESKKERCREMARLWRKNNLAYDAFRARTYRAQKDQALPSWANLEKIKEIYLQCPPGYHVDHIVPLRGKTVCGLHVENNLQHLPAVENLRKRNFYA